MKTRLACIGVLLLALNSIRAADPFAENVRTTEPLTPAEEQKTFSLPPGFAIQLVASEPDINKPMNLAIDAKGRLWVTSSREYPFPVPPGEPARDKIKVFEDFDENGRARKVTTFAEGLDIPIGIYPYKNGAIVWSIPNIWFFEDTDGDGKADKKEILYGPFGWERDTHGNQGSFQRGFDGLLYATHGYNNISNIRAKDGSEIHMHSGNSYRFAMDGSHIEQFTHGQVNPFGLTFDSAGDLFSADCHSLPVYLLQREAYYPSFGKPHDGLGFGPMLMSHLHGSTAIAGIVVYEEGNWPAEFRKNSFIGNVMTSRINRDTLVRRGSGYIAREEADFVSTTDPWFRPNYLHLGPDGAMYVADFYNRIIGHYEVPLTHPGRDRERGRVWRVVYTNGYPTGPLKVEGATPEESIAHLGKGNLPARMLAMNDLVDRFGNKAVEPLKKKLAGRDLKSTEIVHSLWALDRLNALDFPLLEMFSHNPDSTVRVHVMRILSEIPKWTSAHQKLALSGFSDSEPQVQRAAADANSQHPNAENVGPLLSLRSKIPAEDEHLLHGVRIALRDQLVPEENLRQVMTQNLSDADARAVADVCLAITNAQSAAFLVNYIQKENGERPERVMEYARHSARYAPPEQLPQLASFVQKHFPDDVDQQLAFFKSIQEGSAQRGLELPGDVRKWGANLAEKLLASLDIANQSWYNLPVPGKSVSTNPWVLQQRASADGDTTSTFFSSLPTGERLTGILRSRRFELPARLKFFFAGHDGEPGRPPQRKNFVRLVSASTGATLAVSAPPRNDTAQPIEWDLSKATGQQAYLEIVDGDTADAYAWIAVGRFQPEVVPMPALSPNQMMQRVVGAASLVESLGIKSLSPRIGALLLSDSVDMDGRAALARTLVAVAPNENRTALAPLVGDPTISADVRKRIGEALAQGDKTDSLEVLIDAMKTSPSRVQVKLAQSLAGSATGARALLGMVEKSQASPRVLLDKVVQDKLGAIKDDALQTRLKNLTKDLTPASEVVQKLIEERRVAYNPVKAQPVEGSRVFAQNCAVCHQIDGNGAVVGPQLDGIGNRGLERILEDILDPNRNVDVNFRTHIIVLKDSDVVTGLPRREEGEILVLADSTGKEIRIAKNNIESRRESDTSLMPSNFGDIIPPDDFQNLLAFLLSKGAPAAR
jgi:putative heme-binding domain-containing protein